MGEDSFDVGRPLGGPLGVIGDHHFNVTGADFIGDPNATVNSFGRMDSGMMGPVDSGTLNEWSGRTSLTDQNFWTSLGPTSPLAVQINAPGMSQPRLIF